MVLAQTLSFTSADMQWSKFGAPILGPTPASWDSDYTTNPKVVLVGNTFRMWYDGSLAGVTGIGYASSIDGVTWTKYPTAILTHGDVGSWDSSQVSLGSVIWNGTAFLMWYRASNADTFPNGAVGLATSADGISWMKYSRNPILKPTDIDRKYIASPFVLMYQVTNAYYMWYTGKSNSDLSSRILYATSFDGINWFKWPSPVLLPSSDGNAWDSGSVFSPSVIYDATVFGMWYSGLSQGSVNPQIGFASSPDGATWTKSSANPILSPGPTGNWDSYGVEQSSAVFRAEYMLFYDGFSKDSGGRIGLAKAPQSFNIPEFPYSTISMLVITLLSVGCLFRNRSIRKRNEFIS